MSKEPLAVLKWRSIDIALGDAKIQSMNTAHTLSEKQHIAVTAGVCGGRPCIAGTRIRVQDIVLRTESGQSPDEILAAFPHISIADVHAALAYYHDNRDAIDGQIAESDATVTAFKTSH